MGGGDHQEGARHPAGEHGGVVTADGGGEEQPGDDTDATEEPAVDTTVDEDPGRDGHGQRAYQRDGEETGGGRP